MEKKAAPIPLLLFAKAPIAGKVKTRLQTHCSAEQAAAIATILLEASLQRVCEYWQGPVYLSTWLDTKHPSLLALSERFNVEILAQCEGDLGRKMNHAFEGQGYPMAIMGCDAPHILPESLEQLYQVLEQGRSAIGPSCDGGYYIIGLAEPAPYLFEDMPWGSDKVLGLTRDRQYSSGLDLLELRALQDVDEWSDLLAVQKHLPQIASYLGQQKLV